MPKPYPQEFRDDVAASGHMNGAVMRPNRSIIAPLDRARTRS